MSGFNSPRAVAPVQQPKQMSSRLATMKFMQRASNSLGATNQSQSKTASTEPPSKRRRTDFSTSSSAPGTPTYESQSYSNRVAIPAALRAGADAESNTRAWHDAGGGETQWVLDLNMPATNGHAESEGEEDSEEDDIWSPSQATGRQTYGSFKRKKRTTTTTTNADNDADLSSANESASEADSDSEVSVEEIKPASRKRKVPNAFDDDSHLDKIDLSRSSYAKAKGAFLPSNGGAGSSSGRYGKPQLNPNKKRGRKTM